MGSSHGKCRRPNGVLKGKDGCSPLYALCGNKPSSVLYNKSLENCSLKLYRVESDEGDHDDVVVMLDCGGRVYANGKKVYPFDNSQADGTEELNVSQIIGELSNGRLPDVFGKGGNLEKHLNPGDYAGALDNLLSIFADTFNELLIDGLKMQDGMRTLEEEKTTLSLKLLELKREQLHSQKLELEKKKLELRVEELEASLSLQSGMFERPTNYKSATLSRSISIGLGDGRFGAGSSYKTGSLRRDGRLPMHPRETKNGHHQPRHRVVARLRELEVEREKITHQSSLLQFQLDALSAQHEVVQSKGKMNQAKGQEQNTKQQRKNDIDRDLEKLSTSSNASSVSGGSPQNSAALMNDDDDPFENGSSAEDYPLNDSPKKHSRPPNVNGLITNAGKSDITNRGSSFNRGLLQQQTNGMIMKRSNYSNHNNGFSGYESSEDDHTDGSNGRVVGRSRRRSDEMNGRLVSGQRRGSEDEFTDGSSGPVTRSRRGSSEDYTDGANGRFPNGRSKKGSDNLETIHAVQNESSLGRSESLNDPRFKPRESSWEKYDTLKKRYEDLKKRRANRLQQGGVFVSQDDMSSSPALQQRTTQVNACVDEVSLVQSSPLVDC